MGDSPARRNADFAAVPGRPARRDYEYRRRGRCNVFMATEPLAGRRMTRVTERKTKIDWARFLADIAARHADAERITLVMDNLNTHRPGALYEAFPPAQAKVLWDRFEFVHTPKHGRLAERRRGGAQRHDPPVPEPAHRLHRCPARRGRRLAGPPGPPRGRR